MRYKVKHFNIEECSICLDKMNRYKEIIKLRCNHNFHIKCIHEWSLNKNNIIYISNRKIVIKGLCPLCNSPYNRILENKKNNCCIII
jgi:hypothetical protein